MATPSAITAALLSSAYRPQQQDLFSQIDANGDGQISPDELSAFGQNLPGASGTTGLKNRNLFQKIDTNGDGVISKEEWAAHRAARERTQNALLKLQEQAGGANGERYRHHGPSGARQAKPGATFSALDTNKDGVVSAEEWAAAYGGTSGVTVSSDVKPVGATADTGIAGTVNSALDGAANAVKSTVNTISQALNALI
jgi:Ca2+-binding EF-hand superfamily protein